MRQCTNRLVDYNSAMFEDFLELGGGFVALMRAQVSLGADVHGI
jgi:hypothetical protein